MIPLDKQVHFLGGYAIGITFGLVVPVLGLMLAFAVGLGKEVYDKYHPDNHSADKYDFLATLLGGIFGSAITFLNLAF